MQWGDGRADPLGLGLSRVEEDIKIEVVRDLRLGAEVRRQLRHVELRVVHDAGRRRVLPALRPGADASAAGGWGCRREEGMCRPQAVEAGGIEAWRGCGDARDEQERGQHIVESSAAHETNEVPSNGVAYGPR